MLRGGANVKTVDTARFFFTLNWAILKYSVFYCMWSDLHLILFTRKGKLCSDSVSVMYKAISISKYISMIMRNIWDYVGRLEMSVHHSDLISYTKFEEIPLLRPEIFWLVLGTVWILRYIWAGNLAETCQPWLMIVAHLCGKHTCCMLYAQLNYCITTQVKLLDCMLDHCMLFTCNCLTYPARYPARYDLRNYTKFTFADLLFITLIECSK